MTESLPLEDVRAMVRLLGEVAVLEGSIPKRRRYLLEGLARIIGADVWMWILSGLTSEGQAFPYWLTDGGWANDRQRTLVLQADCSPEMLPIRAHLLIGRHVTRSRNQILSDAEWYASTFYKKYRKGSGLDDFMMSIYPLGPKTVSGIGYQRRSGREPFGPRERCIVHVVTSEIDWLHRADSDVPATKNLSTLCLSPRQTEVLALILHGDSRKQIAHKLNLSLYTIAEYIDTLYRRFRVSTRGELLAKFMSGGGDVSP
ncbi:MAG TPA: helix-turn-helix transcriptional regulator [Chloroflexota bacterium]|nr:helix-turn-helix transcriptional regulator [Chloroflexota bacterium]